MLCYGKNKDETLAKEAIENYFKLKKLVENEIESKAEKGDKNKEA